MASSTTPADNNKTASSEIPKQQQQPLPLPPAPEHTTSDGPGVLTLDAQGGSVSLDHLGPMVVHKDGTMSRIANWAEMTAIERENTLRVLGKRNQLRLGDLRKEAAAKEGEQHCAGQAEEEAQK